MNRKTAKQIKELAKLTGRSEKSLKKQYYKMGDNERFLMKKEMAQALSNPELLEALMPPSKEELDNKLETQDTL